MKDSNNNIDMINDKMDDVNNGNHQHQQHNYPPICFSCQKPIFDRFLHNVLERYWHVQCLRCADCNQALTERCYERDNKLFCSKDYRKRMYTKCSLCCNIILPSEFVQHSRGSSVYHLKCFMCVMCQKQLAPGEEYCLVDDCKPVCKEDYFRHLFPSTRPSNDPPHHQHHHSSDNTINASDISKVTSPSIIGSNKPDNGIDNNSDIKLHLVDDNRNHKDMLITSKQIGMLNNDLTSNKLITTTGCLPPTSGHHPNFLHFPDSLQINASIGESPDFLINSNHKPHLFCPTNTNLIIQPPMAHSLHHLPIENHSGDSQMMTPDQSDQKKQQMGGQNNNGTSSEKDGEICSLDDDLKSSFSAASSPDCCPLKDDSQEGQDGNASDDSYQDDQRSMCLPESRDSVQSGGNGTKRRGPRTTIKAKQLDTLKAAFAATPKPTRHVREQLAQDTGLTMRVIQVWFQNRRSKERRMKQLSAMGARRSFFRNPRRMRSLSRGFGPEDHLNPAEAAQLMSNPSYHGYFGDNPEFCNALAALGGNFAPNGPSPGPYPPPMGPPGLHRDFFLTTTSASGLPPQGHPPAFISLSQPLPPHSVSTESLILHSQSNPQQPLGMSV